MKFADFLNPYAYAMKLRRRLYRSGLLHSRSVSVPVISIGNLSVGGTGKTPVTLLLTRYCMKDLGKKTAIVLRGYKRQSTGELVVSDGQKILTDVTKSGDEAQLYAQELPELIVVCDEDRISGARKAIDLGAEVILLDDGYQHLRLQRDLNILLINSDEGIPAVMPFGRGREDSSAAEDADLIIATNYSEDSVHSKLAAPILIRTSVARVKLYLGESESNVTPDIFAGAKLLALSAIGRPERFEKSLSEIASTVIPFRLPDHTEYDVRLLKQISSKASEERCDYIATTTKDAVKMLEQYRLLQKQNPSLPPLAVVHSEINFVQGKEMLFSKINDLFTSRS